MLEASGNVNKNDEFAYSNTCIMVHDLSAGNWGRWTDMEI